MTAFRLPALIVASLLSFYAALWFFKRTSIAALTLQSGLIAFAISLFMLFCAIAALCGIGNGWRNRTSRSAPGEAFVGFLLLLGLYLFNILMNALNSVF